MLVVLEVFAKSYGVGGVSSMTHSLFLPGTGESKSEGPEAMEIPPQGFRITRSVSENVSCDRPKDLARPSSSIAMIDFKRFKNSGH